MRKLILILMAIVLSSMVSAAVVDDLKELSSKYQDQPMPGAFKAIFGNERMNIYLGNTTLNAVTEEGVLKSFGDGLLDDPTINVYASEETVKKVLEAEDKQQAAKEAIKEVKIEGATPGKKFKLFFVKIGATIASWFM